MTENDKPFVRNYKRKLDYGNTHLEGKNLNPQLKNMDRRPTYDELVNELIEKKDKIQLPNRTARFLRETPELSRFDDMSYVDLDEQNNKILQEQIRLLTIRQSMHGNTVPPSVVNMYANQSSSASSQSSHALFKIDTSSSEEAQREIDTDFAAALEEHEIAKEEEKSRIRNIASASLSGSVSALQTIASAAGQLGKYSAQSFIRGNRDIANAAVGAGRAVYDTGALARDYYDTRKEREEFETRGGLLGVPRPSAEGLEHYMEPGVPPNMVPPNMVAVPKTMASLRHTNQTIESQQKPAPTPDISTTTPGYFSSNYGASASSSSALNLPTVKEGDPIPGYGGYYVGKVFYDTTWKKPSEMNTPDLLDKIEIYINSTHIEHNKLKDEYDELNKKYDIDYGKVSNKGPHKLEELQEEYKENLRILYDRYVFGRKQFFNVKGSFKIL